MGYKCKEKIIYPLFLYLSPDKYYQYLERVLPQRFKSLSSSPLFLSNFFSLSLLLSSFFFFFFGERFRSLFLLFGWVEKDATLEASFHDFFNFSSIGWLIGGGAYVFHH